MLIRDAYWVLDTHLQIYYPVDHTGTVWTYAGVTSPTCGYVIGEAYFDDQGKFVQTAYDVYTNLSQENANDTS